VLLDNRVIKKPYGRIFLNSLPPYRRTNQIEDVESFFL
jgi:ATP-dependent DNA helicase DinG